jgi:2',3'-cyclic-nucleotide 2'-phosphodiesterase (5'-nucleotidase family)
MLRNILFMVLIVSGCTFKKSALKNQIEEGHEELYSEPSEPKSVALNEGEERIVIASTNDLRGRLSPVEEKYGIRLGGRDVLSQYLKILRGHHKEIVLVDSGDFLPPNTTELAPVHDFYETHNYDAVTIGLTDFNLKLPKGMNSSIDLFKAFTKTSTPPLVLSNFFELKTGRTVEWEGAKPYVIKEIRGVKIGIIGLIAQDIVTKTPVQNRTGFFVEDAVQSTLRHARLLRSLGTDLIVVITHQGMDCGEALAQTAKLPVAKVNFEPRAPGICDGDSDMGHFLERLPPNLVDVVIGGRTGQKNANVINETILLAGFPDGRSLNYVEFVVDKKTRKILNEKTVIHQPVMTCHEFFAETRDCFTQDESVNHDKKIPATFLGQDIVPDVESRSSQTTMVPKRSDEMGLFLKQMKADFAFVPETEGKTQLAVIELNGKEFQNILEQEYNHGDPTHWYPSPFVIKGEELHLTISTFQNYRILADVESLLKSPYLRSKVVTAEVQQYSSWNHLEVPDSDEVQTTLAAPVTISDK